MQNINLYDRKEIKSHYLIQSQGIMQILLVFLILLLMLGVIEWIQTYNLGHEHATLQQALDEKSNKLLSIVAASPNKQVDEQLEKQINSLITKRDHKIHVLSLLSKQKLGNGQGFSQYFTSLSNQWIENIWLTNISITGNADQLSLIGKTNNPVYVPLLLQKLTEEPIFAGKTFQSFSISDIADDDNYLSFELNSKIPE